MNTDSLLAFEMHQVMINYSEAKMPFACYHYEMQITQIQKNKMVTENKAKNNGWQLLETKI